MSAERSEPSWHHSLSGMVVSRCEHGTCELPLLNTAMLFRATLSAQQAQVTDQLSPSDGAGGLALCYVRVPRPPRVHMHAKLGHIVHLDPVEMTDPHQDGISFPYLGQIMSSI